VSNHDLYSDSDNFYPSTNADKAGAGPAVCLVIAGRRRARARAVCAGVER